MSLEEENKILVEVKNNALKHIKELKDNIKPWEEQVSIVNKIIKKNWDKKKV